MAKKAFFKGEKFIFSRVKGNAETDYREGDINITPANIGLGNVDNTADKDKSVKYATSAGSANSVTWDKVSGKPSTYTPTSHKHSNVDITSLDASKITSGTIDIDRLPQGALDRLIKVADDTARFKLTTADVQLGDTVQTLDNKKMYYVVDETKLSSADGYAPYTADTATSVPWSGVTGKPSNFTPSAHTHDDRYYTESEMDTKLNGKVDLSADGVSKAINKLSTGASTPSDGDYYVSQYVGGGTATTSYHRRPMSALWNYIKSKADSVYAKVSHTHANYLLTSGDSASCTTTFTSGDSSTGSSTAPAVIASGETHASLFNKISTAVKNVRWLLSKMGTTDISSIGNGTVTGALSTLNSNIGLVSIPNFKLTDNQQLSVQLDAGMYVFVNSHIFNALQITVFTIMKDYGINLNDLLPNPSVSIIGTYTCDVGFVANGLCNGRLFRLIKY